jgi:site-specific recombinase XerD
MNGTDIYTVQKLLGHSSIKTTEIYARLAPDFLKAAVERLRF